MDNPNFEALTDAEINRWVVLHDEKLFGDWRFDERCVHNYAASADAALALCERWGIEIREATNETYDKQWIVGVSSNDVGDGLVYTAPTFARATTNAACAARHAKEMADATN